LITNFGKAILSFDPVMFRNICRGILEAFIWLHAKYILHISFGYMPNISCIMALKQTILLFMRTFQKSLILEKQTWLQAVFSIKPGTEEHYPHFPTNK